MTMSSSMKFGRHSGAGMFYLSQFCISDVAGELYAKTQLLENWWGGGRRAFAGQLFCVNGPSSC